MERLITHTIDPDGEVIIILCNANAPFAELNDDTYAIIEMLGQDATVEAKEQVKSLAETAEDAFEHDFGGFGASSVTQSKKNSKKAKKKAKKKGSLSPVEMAVRPEPEPEPEPAEPGPVNESVVELEEWPVEEPESKPEFFHESTPETDKYQPEHNVYIQVSAKHLTLASPVFKSMLTGPWTESITCSKLQKGSIEITTESWDTDAFLILLKIIHCQFNQVPRKLSLEMLAKVAVIADYYECKEVVQFFSDTWIVVLEEVYPEKYSRDLILRLWIAWFFRLSSQFRTVTSIAMSHTGGLISNLGLPIPKRVIGKPPIAPCLISFALSLSLSHPSFYTFL